MDESPLNGTAAPHFFWLVNKSGSDMNPLCWNATLSAKSPADWLPFWKRFCNRISFVNCTTANFQCLRPRDTVCPSTGCCFKGHPLPCTCKVHSNLFFSLFVIGRSGKPGSDPAHATLNITKMVHLRQRQNVLSVAGSPKVLEIWNVVIQSLNATWKKNGCQRPCARGFNWFPIVSKTCTAGALWSGPTGELKTAHLHRYQHQPQTANTTITHLTPWTILVNSRFKCDFFQRGKQRTNASQDTPSHPAMAPMAALHEPTTPCNQQQQSSSSLSLQASVSAPPFWNHQWVCFWELCLHQQQGLTETETRVGQNPRFNCSGSNRK